MYKPKAHIECERPLTDSLGIVTISMPLSRDRLKTSWYWSDHGMHAGTVRVALIAEKAHGQAFMHAMISLPASAAAPWIERYNVLHTVNIPPGSSSQHQHG